MSEHTHKKTMAKETFLYLPAKLLEGFIGIFTISCYAALFSPQAYGDYLFLNTIVIFLSLILMGWLVNSTTRFVGENTTEAGLKQFFSTAFSAWFAVAIAVYAVCTALYFISQRQLLYLCPAFLFTSYSLFQILSAALVQLRRIKLNIILSLTSAALKLMIAYGVFFMTPGSFELPYPAIAASFFSDFIVALIALIALKIPASLSAKSFSYDLTHQFFRFGFPLLGVSISIGLLNMVDRFIVMGFADNTSLAVYNANYSISSSVFTLVMAAVMRGVYPSILEGFRCGGKDETLPLLNYGARMYILIALPAAAGLIAVSSTLSRCMFTRPEYAEGIPVIGLIAAAMFFMGLTEYANKAWELSKSTLPILQNSAAAVVVKVVASIILIRLVGVSGAALGTALAFVFYFMLTALRVRKIFIFKITIKSWLSILLSSLLCAAAAFSICSFSPLPSLVTLALAVLTGAALYAGALAVSGEIKNEIAHLRARMGKHE